MNHEPLHRRALTPRGTRAAPPTPPLRTTTRTTDHHHRHLHHRSQDEEAAAAWVAKEEAEKARLAAVWANAPAKVGGCEGRILHARV